ncbi:response regulator [Paenibacillus sp. CN-4]|uniref:response regulator n=1 Tax=Paenibacillus nanchangensis TaxID=3348343 RepID=UPI00397C9A2F
MMKLLIVDDEKNIRYGLQTMIEREYPGVYSISTAGNGQEALEGFLEERADLIITDIRMPVMDGIQLIEQIAAHRNGGTGPEVIILSGYDDFEYAKSAIRYRVKDYLLKPIRRDELFGALESIAREREEREQNARRQELAAEGMQRELLAGRLRQLFAEAADPEGIPDFPGLRFPLTAGAVSFRQDDGTPVKPAELQSLTGHLGGPLEKRFEAAVTDLEGRLILLSRGRERFTELSRQAAAKGMTGFLIGIGRECGNAGELRSSYREACRALQYTFLYPQSGLMTYEDLGGQRLSFPPPDEELRKLLNMLGTGREKEMKMLLAAIFHTDHLGEIDLSYLELAGRRMNERVLDEVFRTHGEASMEVLKLYRQVGNMYQFRSFHDYYRALEHLLSSVSEYIAGLRSAHTGNSDIEAAIRYIEQHYHRPLNMATVSNHVSLNYSYFSEAFKAYTGESFVVYLKKVRIGHAKRLMAEGRRKLAEIGEAVGFENSKQFARVFKELEGISPGEYKAKLMNHEIVWDSEEL